MVLSRVVSKHRTILMLCFILVGSLVSITADLRASLLLDTIGSLVSSGFYPIEKGLTALKQSVYNVRETVGSVAELRQEGLIRAPTSEELEHAAAWDALSEAEKQAIDEELRHLHLELLLSEIIGLNRAR